MMKIVIATILIYVAFNNGISVKANSGRDDRKEQLVSGDKDAANLVSQASVDFPTVPSDGGICLSTHNNLRALHRRTPNLVWDSHLSSEAQKWANHLASIFEVKHATTAQRPGQGENLAHIRIPPGNNKYHPMTCEEAIKGWYTEINNYDWKNPGEAKNGKPIGHFEQVVWKSTKKVGMGIKVVKKDGWTYTYVVGRYTPASNVPGEYGHNIMTLKAAASPCDSNPCQNQGVCFSRVTSYSCECSNIMYYGKNCEIKRACEDTSKLCRANKHNFCSGRKVYDKYLIQCLETCGKCTRCNDEKPYCAKWKKEICNDCRYSQHKKYCRNTCDICSTPPSIPASQCRDTKWYCVKYQKDICNNYLYCSYKKHCKKTCGLC